MSEKINIHFWCIGGQKCGTTWLYKNLKSINEFTLPPIKELHYFDRSSIYPTPNYLEETLLINRIFNTSYFKNALNHIYASIKSKNQSELFFYLRWHFSNYTDNWYSSLFRSLTGIKGDITPSYAVMNEEDIIRMYTISPQAKIIFLVRNPIERAWSHYKHNKRSKIKNILLDSEEIINFFDTAEQELRSDYVRTIRNFSSVFPHQQMLICFYDAIIDCPEILLNQIINFVAKNNSIVYKGHKLNKIINKSPEAECPSNCTKYLKEKYHDQIKLLAESYGGYFYKWYEEAYHTKLVVANTTLTPTFILPNV